MDLQRLRIDRDPSAEGRTSAQRRPSRLKGGLIAVALLASLGLALGPGRRMIEALVLPRVQVAVAAMSDAAAAGALRGTAANGHVVAARRAALSTDLPGRIVELNVTEGSLVREGDVVARLYAADYEAALDEADAQFAGSIAALARATAARDAAASSVSVAERNVSAAEARLDEALSAERLAGSDEARAERLAAEGISATRELDAAASASVQASARRSSIASERDSALASLEDAKARAAVAVSEIEVARAQVKAAGASRDQAAALLQKTVVRAPFDGVVVLKDAELGEVVSPDSGAGGSSRGSVCTLVDLASLEVQADVPETSLAAVSLGARVSIFLDAHPDRAYGGAVTRIWPTANRQKATVEVRAAFDAPDAFLRPEMGLRLVFLPEDAEATAPESRALLVPDRALLADGGRDALFVLERDRVRLRVVVLGERRGGRVSVESGLSEGERVVLDPPASLDDGDRVLVGVK